MALRDKLRVLVVDDTATSRGLIIQTLEKIGVANLSWEKDGEAALNSLNKSPRHLIISDYNMPKMDGLTLLKEIRSDPKMRNTGFILITGTTDSDVVERGKKLGMNNYIPKPFSPDGLRACIEAVTGRL